MSRFYVPIAKVDAETRMVYGYASTEARDDQGEIITRTALQGALDDYMRFANIREMHQMSAVGVAKEANVDDKGLFVGAKVIDPLAWEKVTSGVYKGFSIGGRVKERNPSDRSIITGLNLTEISLVDRPANPEAVFDCWKATASLRDPVRDGKGWSCGDPSHRHHVKSAAAACIRKSAAALDDPDAADAGQGDNTMADTAMAAALKAAGVTTDTPAEPEQTVSQDNSASVEQVWKASDGATFKTKSEAERHSLAVAAAATASAAAAPATAALDRLDVALAKREASDPAEKAGDEPGDGSEPDGDVAYADPGYRDGKKRYPIDTEEHIRAAWSYIHQKRNADKYTDEQVAHIKAKIVAAWKAKIDKDGPPQADDSKKATIAVLAKSLWDVGRIASIIQELRWIVEGLKIEAAMEGDQSEAAKELEAICGRVCAFLVDLVKEETGEIAEGTEVPPEDVALAAGIGATGFARIAALLPDDSAAKGWLSGMVKKAGAKMSGHDQAMIDLAAHIGRVAGAMPGTPAGSIEHINAGVAALEAAGASSALHSGVYDSEAGVGRGGNTAPPQVTPPAPQYHGQNATVDSAHAPAHPAPQVDASGSGSGSGIDHIAAAAIIDTLSKRSASHKALLTVAHDLINDAAGMPLCEAAKAGARHGAEVMGHLREAHDRFVRAGAMHAEEEGQGTEFDTAKAAVPDLAKVVAENDALKGELRTIGARFDTLAKRVEEIAAQPLPPKAAARDIEIPAGLRTVSKAADGGGTTGPAAALDDAAVIKHLNGLSEEARAMLLIKAAQSDPRNRFVPGVPR